jgi:hypothetical protein
MVKKHHCPRKGKGEELPQRRIILQDPERPNKLDILREHADDSILQFYNLCQIVTMDFEDIWIRSYVRDGKSIRYWSPTECCRKRDRVRKQGRSPEHEI